MKQLKLNFRPPGLNDFATMMFDYAEKWGLDQAAPIEYTPLFGPVNEVADDDMVESWIRLPGDAGIDIFGRNKPCRRYR